jgi:WD40 repeat protein
VLRIDFSRDGKRISTTSEDKTARIWESSTGKQLHALVGHTEAVSSAVFSPDGTHIVTVGLDNTVRVWNAMTGESIHAFSDVGRVMYAGFSSDGTRIVAPTLDDVDVWSLSTGQRLPDSSEEYADAVMRDAFPPGSNSFSSKNAYVSPSLKGNTAQIREAGSDEARTLTGHSAKVRTAVFSPDGNRVVTASEDGTARIWDARTGKSIHTLLGHANTVENAIFSPNGSRVLTTSSDSTARIWDSQTGKSLATLMIPQRFSITGFIAVTFSPDSERAVIGTAGSAVYIWSTNTGFHSKAASEQVELACRRLKQMRVYDFSSAERGRFSNLKDLPPNPCGAPPPGVPAWPEGGPKY